jgi:hypothetical protein
MQALNNTAVKLASLVWIPTECQVPVHVAATALT